MLTIITKTYCPYCSGAKKFLDALDIEYDEIEISSNPELYETYKQISGMKTVPQIFDGTATRENLIGGYDDMMRKYNAGEIFTN